MPALFISSSCSVRASTLADNSLCFPSASLRFWISWSSRALGMRPSSFQSARYFFSSSVSCSPATIFPMTSLSSIFCSLLFATSAFNVLADGCHNLAPAVNNCGGVSFLESAESHEKRRRPQKTAKPGSLPAFARFLQICRLSGLFCGSPTLSPPAPWPPPMPGRLPCLRRGRIPGYSWISPRWPTAATAGAGSRGQGRSARFPAGRRRSPC